MRTRPASITAVVVLLCLAGITMLAGAVASLVLLARPGAVQELFGQPVGDGYWLLVAFMSATLAAIVLLLARLVASGDPSAGLAVSVMSMCTLGFAAFSIAHPGGWLLLGMGLAMLIINQTGSAQAWYRPDDVDLDQAQT